MWYNSAMKQAWWKLILLSEQSNNNITETCFTFLHAVWVNKFTVKNVIIKY